MVRVYHTPECQRWAVWALANLTTVYRTLFSSEKKHKTNLQQRLIVAEKYCHLVEKEGGLELLKELTLHADPPLEVKKLAAIVLDNSYKYKHHDWQQELDG